jgi:hypothetical protein
LVAFRLECFGLSHTFLQCVYILQYVGKDSTETRKIRSKA